MRRADNTRARAATKSSSGAARTVLYAHGSPAGTAGRLCDPDGSADVNGVAREESALDCRASQMRTCAALCRREGSRNRSAASLPTFSIDGNLEVVSEAFRVADGLDELCECDLALPKMTLDLVQNCPRAG